MPTDEELGSGTGLSSVYAVKLGSDGVMGIENQGIQVERIGSLESSDATRWRIKFHR